MSKRKINEEHVSYWQALEEHAEAADTRCEVMDSIQDYLDGSYFLGINPLRELRRIFPKYVWCYHQLKEQKQAREVISQSDFIWRANYSSLDEMDGIELFTATAYSPRKPLRVFWAGEKNASETSTSLIDNIKDIGGEPEYFEIVNR
jgi:hypothetical protein